MTEITFGESASRYVIDTLGYSLDPEGYIIEDGERVEDLCGEEVHYTELGGFGKINGENVVVRDNFVSVCEYVEQKHTQEQIDRSIDEALDGEFASVDECRDAFRK